MRTREQIAADDVLTAAIERALVAYGVKDPQDTLMEHITVVAMESLDMEEGEVSNSTAFLLRDGRVHTSRAIGLLEDIKLQLVLDQLKG